FMLYQNYPNPFNPTTQISYQIPKDRFVNLTVYNSLGQEVAMLVNRQQSVGRYTVQFNANNLPSGVYFYKLQASEFNQVKKMLLVR
ncbi:MAG: T9SS type A sorting domain-containing protein, partial [Chlorobi bacterium]|nr:T9SS type A sorting domain-containing protein [Chlorobiota bacterium]